MSEGSGEGGQGPVDPAEEEFRSSFEQGGLPTDHQPVVELPEEVRDALASAAQEHYREHPPEHEVIGLILENGTQEAAQFAKVFESMTGQALPAKNFVGLVPRDFVVSMLRATAPAALDWVPDSDFEGEMHGLPFVIGAAGGFQMGVLRYDAS